MADEAKDKDAAQGDAGAARKGGRKLLLLGSTVLVCLAGAVVVGIVAFPEPLGTHDAVPEEVLTETTMQAVPQVIVNLAESNGLRLLQATMSLELRFKDPHAAEKLQDLMTKAQDRIIKVLSSLTPRDIEGAAAKEFIQTRIKDDLNGGLLQATGVEVKAVFFTEFVVQ